MPAACELTGSGHRVTFIPNRLAHAKMGDVVVVAGSRRKTAHSTPIDSQQHIAVPQSAHFVTAGLPQGVPTHQIADVDQTGSSERYASATTVTQTAGSRSPTCPIKSVCSQEENWSPEKENQKGRPMSTAVTSTATLGQVLTAFSG